MNRTLKYTWLQTVAMLGLLCLPAAAQQLQGKPEKPAPSPKADAYYHFTLARLYDASGDFAAALSEYETALKSDPDNAQIRAEYSVALADVGRTDDALKSAQQALEKDSSNVDAHLLMGDIYFRVRLRQDPKARELAVQEYETVLRLDPDNLSALSSLGRLYISANQYPKAEEIFQKLVNSQPDAVEEFFLLALSQAEQRKFDAALQNTKRVLQVNPSNIRALALQGFIYERLHDDDAAIAAYQQILKVQPQDADAKRRLAALLAEKGRAGDATQMLEELAKRNPFDSSVLLELGKAQREQKKYPEAIASFRAAAKTDADGVEIAYWLATTLAETGERDEAISILKRLAERGSDPDPQQPSRFPILTQMGMIQQDDAQYDAAISTFEQLARSFPEDFRSYLYLANAYRLKKEWKQAAEVISRGRQKFPDERGLVITQAQIDGRLSGLEKGLQVLDEEIRRHSGSSNEQGKATLLQLRLSRAQLLVDHHDSQAAEGELLQLNSEFPANELILFQLGAAYERQEKFAKAEEVFKALLDKNSENPGVLNYLGYMWADRGENLEQALQYIQKAVGLDPFNGAYLDSLGWAQFKLNDLKGAVENLSKAAKIVPNDSTIHEHLGDLHQKLGHYQEALQAYRLSLSYASDAAEADKIQEKIRKLDKLSQK
ncbi:MAG: tetratricopeptide repeat protein [Acidobacteria bacterium]|nr:tetratricopeptide repeat protein [Acidobacteriota bacterium]